MFVTETENFRRSQPYPDYTGFNPRISNRSCKFCEQKNFVQVGRLFLLAGIKFWRDHRRICKGLCVKKKNKKKKKQEKNRKRKRTIESRGEIETERGRERCTYTSLSGWSLSHVAFYRAGMNHCARERPKYPVAVPRHYHIIFTAPKRLPALS